MRDTVDFLIIGGGVVGLTVALELRARHPRASVVILEKEPHCGEHASGRNSGVLHAGFYYTPDSLKARLTRDGCRAWTEYHEEHGLPIRRCGKLVVTSSGSELPELERLYARGQTNGVPLELIDATAAREIEPRVRTVEKAIWSPTTASVDPGSLMRHLADRCEAEGIKIRLGTTFLERTATGVRVTGSGSPAGAGQGSKAGPGPGSGPRSESTHDIDTGYVVNAAGLYADRVARAWGFSNNYRVVPFRGTYLYGDARERLRTNIYPVPDSRFAFLGVHFTVTVAGEVKIGPTAMPGLWREQYGGLAGFRLRDSMEVSGQVAGLLVRGGAPFRRHAMSEMRKLSGRHLVRLASMLADDVMATNYTRWGRPGIRAQLVDQRNGQLENDFALEGDASSMHILNAVSPAFTCALPFAAHVVDRIEEAPR